MTPVQILDDAVQILREQGWVRGHWVERVGGKLCFCAGGALMRAAGAEVLDEGNLAPALTAMPNANLEAYVRARNAVENVLVPGRAIPRFNDVDAKDVDDVIAKLERAREQLLAGTS